MRRSLFGIVLACSFGFAAPAAGQDVIAHGDSARVETVEKFLVVADLERIYDASIETSIAAQLEANPMIRPYEDLLRSFMAKYASYDAMKPDFVRIYREAFAEADMQEMIRFYQTDFGQRLMKKLPALMARSAELGTQRVQDHLPELTAQIRARSEAEADSARDQPDTYR